MRFSLWAALITAVGLASCGSGEGEWQAADGGYQYKMIKDSSARVAQVGDLVRAHFVYRTDKDSVIGSSYSAGNPIPVKIVAPPSKLDMMNALMKLSAGDSALFKYPTDSLFKGAPAGQRPPFFPSGSYLTVGIRIFGVESDKERSANEKKELESFAAKKGLKAQSTPSGLMYAVTTPSSGISATKGDSVVVKYKGMLLDEKVFDPGDSPLRVLLGSSPIIKGFEEGISVLKEGEKGWILIPNELGYGEYGSPPLIPSMAPLAFEIEILKVKKNAKK